MEVQSTGNTISWRIMGTCRTSISTRTSLSDSSSRPKEVVVLKYGFLDPTKKYLTVGKKRSVDVSVLCGDIASP